MYIFGVFYAVAYDYSLSNRTALLIFIIQFFSRHKCNCIDIFNIKVVNLEFTKISYRNKMNDHLPERIKSERLMDENELQLQSVSSDKMEDPKTSLEDKMIREKNRKTLTLANIEKEKTRCLLRGLREELEQVLASNKLLPEPLQFSDDYFQLDERIHNSIIKEEQSKMEKLELTLAFDYEKSLIGLKKVKNYFVANILTNNFEVKAILYGISANGVFYILLFSIPMF